MRRVAVYIDYSNVYKGARDAFLLREAPGYRGNIRPVALARRVALVAPDGSARGDTHRLSVAKVFRGAPDPGREPIAALMEAKRAHEWERDGAIVYRHALNYARGYPVEKGVDVRLANTLLLDVLRGEADVVVLVSADKDFRYALINVLEVSDVEVEVAIWQAVPGGRALGRIELRPERPGKPEVPCHKLTRRDFEQVEDTLDYRRLPPPPGWN